MKSNKNKLVGAYVVTEPSCLNPYSGAHQHIKTGIKELQKHFSIITLLPETPTETKAKLPKEKSKSSIYARNKRLSYFVGSLRDLKILIFSSLNALVLSYKIFRSDIDFVYYRASFLNPLPLFLSFLNIPCFVEANGLQFDGRKKYYRSLLESLNKWFEYITYSASKHVFFIGSYGDYWKLKKKNWSNIENGVEHEFLNIFSTHKKSIKEKIHLALIARLMAHHQPQVLISAIKELDSKTRSKLCLHLIGSGLDIIKAEIQKYVEVIDHGFLNREQLAACLKQIHAGLIPGVPEYQSQMKLFDYGAAKCVAIVPRVHNLDYWFNDSEIEFFEPENQSSLAKIIKDITDSPEKFAHKGNQLHQRIANEFTWETIFLKKAELIRSLLD